MKRTLFFIICILATKNFADIHFIRTQQDYENLINGAINISSGDEIKLKQGQIFYGQFKPKESGNAIEGSIILTSYLDPADPSDALPIINGGNPGGWGSANRGTLFFNNNNQHWEIKNLHIQNPSSGHKNGILFLGNDNTNELKNIVIENCIIDNVGGWGIKISCGEPWDPTQNTKYNGIYIRNNIITASQHRAISIMNAHCSLDPFKRNEEFWFENVFIENNRITDSRSDGIVVWGAVKPVIRNNIVNGAGNGSEIGGDFVGNGNGIFIAFTKEALIEYNEVFNTYYDDDYDRDGKHENRSQNAGKRDDDDDSAGIDIDHVSENCIVQYNYIHNNDMHGIEIIAIDHGVKNATIRYNIFKENWNGSATRPYQKEPSLNIAEYSIPYKVDRYGEIYILGNAKNCYFYNNVFYEAAGNDEMILVIPFWKNNIKYESNNIFFFNNIFYHRGSGKYSLPDGYTFFNNCYYGIDPSNLPTDPGMITANPNLAIDGGADGKAAFKLRPGSSCIGAGTRSVANQNIHSAIKDFYSNTITGNQSLNIGVDQSRPD